MENFIGMYVVIAILVSTVWAMMEEDWVPLLRGLFWPLYLVRWVIRDLKR